MVKCLACSQAHRGIAGITIREQSDIDVGLSQQRRSHRCQSCRHEWETIEMPLAEVLRLRRLAHAHVMSAVKSVGGGK